MKFDINFFMAEPRDVNISQYRSLIAESIDEAIDHISELAFFATEGADHYTIETTYNEVDQTIVADCTNILTNTIDIKIVGVQTPKLMV